MCHLDRVHVVGEGLGTSHLVPGSNLHIMDNHNNNINKNHNKNLSNSPSHLMGQSSVVYLSISISV